jgi:hypothetical protein
MINKKRNHNSELSGSSKIRDLPPRAKAINEIPKTSFSSKEINISPSKTTAGSVVSISCSVTNDGEIIGEHISELRINGEIVERQTLILFGGKTQVINFNRVFSDPGEYEVEIDDLKSALLVKQAKPIAAPTTHIPKPSNAVPNKIKLSDLKIEPAVMAAGETATVSCLLTNEGRIDQQYKAELKINNQVVGTQSILLVPEQQKRVVFSGSIEDPGEHTIAIGFLKGKLVVTG